MEMTYDQTLAILNRGIHRLRFTKMDGTERTYDATRDPEHIPPAEFVDKPTVAESETLRERDRDLGNIRFYSPEKGGWRIFNVGRDFDLKVS